MTSRIHTKTSAGFSLVELLVVISIFGIIMVTAVSFFLSTVRGNSRVNDSIMVKQQGDYAIGSMTHMIRNAQRVTACSANSLTILNRDGGSTTYTYIANDRISSNSALLTSSELRVNPTPDNDSAMPPASNFFTCTPAAPNTTTVAIRFILRKGSQAANDARDIVTQVFATTVGLRRY